MSERGPEGSENRLRTLGIALSLSVIAALAVLGGCTACEMLVDAGFGQEPKPKNTQNTFRVSQLPPVLTYQHSNRDWEILLEPDTPLKTHFYPGRLNI